MPAARVHLASEFVGGVGQTDFNVNILTGGVGAPLVTLGDNNGYPHVREILARARVVEGIGTFNVVNLTVRFDEAIPASAVAIAVNVYQDDATEFTFPFIS